MNYFQKFHHLNRKLHIHLGMFVILFLWLFSVSGLLLNHGEWKFAKFYEWRQETKTEFTLPFVTSGDDQELISGIKDYLRISGEVGNIKIKPGSIEFRNSLPGLVHEIQFDSKSNKGSIKTIQYNFWGKLHTLHLFNGVDQRDPTKKPQWIVTVLWRLMMDFIALILVILSVGSWIMWFRVHREYRLGYVVFAFGFIASVYYLFLVDMI